MIREGQKVVVFQGPLVGRTGTVVVCDDGIVLVSLGRPFGKIPGVRTILMTGPNRLDKGRLIRLVALARRHVVAFSVSAGAKSFMALMPASWVKPAPSRGESWGKESI